MMFDIGSTTMGGENTVVIAEAGVNHPHGYAEELIKSAARAGADIVKFQTYKASKLTTQNAPRFWSWEGERDRSGSQFPTLIHCWIHSTRTVSTIDSNVQ